MLPSPYCRWWGTAGISFPGHPTAGQLTAAAPAPDGAAAINGPPEQEGAVSASPVPDAAKAPRNRAGRAFHLQNGRAVWGVILTRTDAEGIVPKVSGMEKSTSTDFFHGAVRSRKGRMNPGLVAGHPMDVFSRQKNRSGLFAPRGFIRHAGFGISANCFAWRACATSGETLWPERGKVAPNACPRRNLIPQCQSLSIGWCADRRRILVPNNRPGDDGALPHVRHPAACLPPAPRQARIRSNSSSTVWSLI